MVRKKLPVRKEQPRVALYLRYSSDRQTEQSIEGQQRVCTSYCEREGMQIVATYIDRALSASKDTDKRLQFLQMIRDSELGIFDAVVVYKLDRFARSRQDSAKYKGVLARNGVRVLSATEGIGEGIESIILESLLEGMAEYYSAELSQKVTRGMRESAYKCNSTGGTIPTGYKIVGKKFVIDEPRAEIVREVFDLFVGGMSISAIQRLLAGRGIKNANGQPFGRTALERMIRNKRYIGVYTYDDIEIEGGVPAIVSKDVFEEAVRRLEIRTTGPKPYSPYADYLLSGKCFCGDCGASMTGEASTSKSGKVYHYYGCPTHRKYGQCSMPRVRKDWLERTAVKDAVNLLSSADIRRQLVELVVSESAKEDDTDLRADALRKEAREIEKKISNLIKLAEDGMATDSTASRLRELEDEKKSVYSQLKAIELQKIALDAEKVDYFLSQFAGGDIDDADFCRKVIDMLIISVTVYRDPTDPDGYKLKYKYSVSPSTGNDTNHSPDGETGEGVSICLAGSPGKSAHERVRFFLFCHSVANVKMR
ncbi:MAG: recombinase family protein [Clostridia bacterium]|nr:recombinase family protein [Clostridia bacterium]